MKIKIITTGGTIDKTYFDAKSTYEVGEPVIGDILREAHVTFEYEVRSLLRKDSLEITDEDRQILVEAIEEDPNRCFLITHGTDTMVDTARYLQERIYDRVIVLTGALSPARFRSTDAIFNAGLAVAAVQLVPNGVYVAMNGCLFKPENVIKNRSLNRFEPI